MRMQDERGALDHARDAGRIEGRQEGLTEGLQKGLAQGEHAKALDTAHKMRAKGYSLADIADLTGLSWQEIERL